MLDFSTGRAIAFELGCEDCDDPTTPIAERIAASLGSTELQRHDRSEYVPIIGRLTPATNTEQRKCISAREVVTPPALTAQIPIGEVIYLSKLVPFSVLKDIALEATAGNPVYGANDVSMAGLVVDVVVDEFTPAGVLVGPVALPANMLGVNLSAPIKVTASVSPATGGNHTDANYFMIGISIVAPPTNNPLSSINGSIYLIPQGLSFSV